MVLTLALALACTDLMMAPDQFPVHVVAYTEGDKKSTCGGQVLDEMDAQWYSCCCQNTDFCCPGADDWSGDCGEEAERVSNEYMTAGTEPPEMPDDG